MLDPTTVTTLKDGGPWGLLVLALGVIAYLYKAREADSRSHAKELKEINEQRLEDFREVMKIVSSFETGRGALIEGMQLVSATMQQLKEELFKVFTRHGGQQ